MIRSVYITGANGFIGKHLCSLLETKYAVTKYQRNEPVVIKEDVVIHLAGLAHDLGEVSNETDYFRVNTDFTKEVFDAFLCSSAKKFIFLSSVKAASDIVRDILTEDTLPQPKTPYGLSKLKAEQYIVSHHDTTNNKQYYILRPAMVYGVGNKGNLNKLYQFLEKGYPWPLGAFNNHRSFCAVENLLFVIDAILKMENFPQGIYNVCDDEVVTTNDLVEWIQYFIGKRRRICKIPFFVIYMLVKLGDLFDLSFNSETFKKLTDSYVVSNKKLVLALKATLPVKTKYGIHRVLKTFKKDVK